MRIGIALGLSHSSGGLYQYGLTMLEALRSLREQGRLDDDFVIFNQGENGPDLSRWAGVGWETAEISYPRNPREKALYLSGRILGDGRVREAATKIYRRLKAKPGHFDPDKIVPRPAIARQILSRGVGMMLYPQPTAVSFEAGVPYIMAVHDLQHRLHPEFPEVSADGLWEGREYMFRNGTRRALLVLVDSEVGKEDVLTFYGPYGVTPDMVKVLPFLPAPYLSSDVSAGEKDRVRRQYNLPERYLFYPAQFWPHKNHIRIVQALAFLKEERRLEADIVLVGTHDDRLRERTFRQVMSLARKLGLGPRVHYLGYAPDEDMSALYAGAVALVMPTFFGPTNIPPLEAWALGCPVLTSDIRGIREQMGHAAVLVDPASVESIADGINRLWMHEELRRTLVDRGRKRLASYGPDEFRDRLAEILEQAKKRVREQKSRV
jgi:glycosyltransferase involved in cell wall biosynthesis